MCWYFPDEGSPDYVELHGLYLELRGWHLPQLHLFEESNMTRNKPRGNLKKKNTYTLFSIGGDESTHQILSYGLLFLTFYHFLYTAGPPTSTTLMWLSPTFTWTFTQSLPTIPYTHRTIGLVPRRRPLIWPTDHIVTFSFLSLFSLPNAVFHGPTNRRSSHHAIGTLPYTSPHTNLVLVLLIICI